MRPVLTHSSRKASWDSIDQSHVLMVAEVYVACQRGRCKRDRALLSHYHGLNLHFIAYYNHKTDLGMTFFAFKYRSLFIQFAFSPQNALDFTFLLSLLTDSLWHRVEFSPVSFSGEHTAHRNTLEPSFQSHDFQYAIIGRLFTSHYI